MIKKLLMLAAVVVVADAAEVAAQDAGESNPNLVWNATSAGALATRSPGRMIDAGIARYNDAQARAFSRPNITEVDDEPGLKKQIKIVFIETLFQNLNALLLAYNNMIRAEAGFPPFVPTPITPSTSTSLL
jgi:hypothetical protein